MRDEALAGAASPSWAQRARAGQDLAAYAADPEAAETLLGLLLDGEDTAVTRRVAEALARVRTQPALRLIALGLAEADDSQGDWILTGVRDVLATVDGAPHAVALLCAQLARDSEAAVRRGAAELSAWVADTGR